MSTLPRQRNPYPTTDAVVLYQGHLVLVRRGREPYRGYLALPGGFVEWGESTEECALRELREETGLSGDLITIVGVYSRPGRDPRGHVLSVTYLVEGQGEVRTSEETPEVLEVSLEELPQELAFDHRYIVRDALLLAEVIGLVP